MSNQEIKEYRDWCDQKGYYEYDLEAIKSFLKERYERRQNAKAKN